jgi:glycosyltransferase involved in cell wall biosynthesis
VPRIEAHVSQNDGQKLRVLVNAVSARVGGGGTHVVSQLAALDALEEVDLTIHATGLVAERLARACPRARIRAERPRGLVRRVLWEQTVLALGARKYDVVYLTGNFGLLVSPRPQIVLIQNAWYFTDSVRDFRKHHCSRRMRARLAVESLAVRASIRRADCVIAISEAAGRAVEADLGPLSHVHVVPSAAPALADLGSPTESAIDLPDARYALVVAHDGPHKELDRLVEAFAAHDDLPHLVVAGGCTAGRLAALRGRLAQQGAQDRMTFLGQVDDPVAVAALYRSARCCIAHSRLEAFGLTPAEALSLGVPVVASDIDAHREVCGGAATYYPVDDMHALMAAVRDSVRRPGAALAPAPVLDRTWTENAHELAGLLRAVAE